MINPIGIIVNPPFWIITILVFGSLLVWMNMPLYPDEVAFRLIGARLFVDNGVEYGLYSACESNFKITHSVFYPVAAFYAALDLLPEWEGARVIPFISVFISVVVVLIFVSKRPFGWSSGFFLIGIIGVSGSGLILSRPEWILLLHGMSCLISFYGLYINKCRPLTDLLMITVLLFIAMLSLYIHMQGAIFIPITILPLVSYVFRSDASIYARSFAFTVILILCVGVWASIQKFHFSCLGFPNVEHFMSAMTIAGIYNDSGWVNTLLFLSDKLLRYIDQFKFKEIYDINYLPSAIPSNTVGQYFVWLINLLITFLLTVNLFFSVVIAIYSAAIVVKKFFVTVMNVTMTNRLNDAAPYLFIFLAMSALLCVFVYDAATNFYRCFYINLLIAITNGMVLSYATDKFYWILRPIGVLSVLICLSSTLVIFEIIRPKIQSGQVGPSIAINTDWKSVKEDVNQLKQSCGIADTTSNILMDDMTYDALKQHPHLIPITYFSLVASLSEGAVDDLLQAHRALFKFISPNAAVMRCNSFAIVDKKPDSQKSSLCCARF